MEPIEPIASPPKNNVDQPAQPAPYDPSQREYNVPNNKKGKQDTAASDAFDKRRRSQSRASVSLPKPVVKVRPPPVASPPLTQQATKAGNTDWKVFEDSTIKKR